jgi:hypothetical protein
MKRNSLCHAEEPLDWLCGRMQFITVSMMCRILVIISPQAYQPRWDIRWGRKKKFAKILPSRAPKKKRPDIAF